VNKTYIFSINVSAIFVDIFSSVTMRFAAAEAAFPKIDALGKN
jgi:hypothetical protein